MSIFDFFKREKTKQAENVTERPIDALEINFQNRDDFEDLYPEYEESEFDSEEINQEGREESRQIKEDYLSYADYDDFRARPNRDSFFFDEER